MGLIANPVFFAADLLLYRQHLQELFIIRVILEVGLGIAFVRERTGLTSDTVIGVFFAGAIGFGAMILQMNRSRRLFDPERSEDIAAAVEDVLADPAEWSRRGLKRARAFAWDETARRHDAVYRELVDGA